MVCPPSNQLQVGQHRAGGSKLSGRQFDLDVADHVRSLGGDPVITQRCPDGRGDVIRTAAVEMVGQCGMIDALWWRS
jgi:hypothetical protein